MPVVPINYAAVVVAAVASMAIGFAWYGPLFGKQWMALSGITPEKIATDKKKGMNKLYALAMLGSLVMSYVLAHALVFSSTYMKVSGVMAGVQVGFWNWLGFVVPVTLGSVLWEGKSWKLWLLNNGYYLVTLKVMGVILAVWK
ncbi:MAG: DUF1761 domain-containing protein [bacterium]|nr:DUF1761 domain-containing protein [bacterium]